MNQPKCHRCETKPATHLRPFCRDCFDDLLEFLSGKSQLLTACEGLIRNADLDESPKANIDTSGWTKSVWVSRKDLIAIETIIRKARGE